MPLASSSRIHSIPHIEIPRSRKRWPSCRIVIVSIAFVPMSLFDTNRQECPEFQATDLQMVIPGSGALQVAKNIPTDPGPSFARDKWHGFCMCVIRVFYFFKSKQQYKCEEDLCNLILKSEEARCGQVFLAK